MSNQEKKRQPYGTGIFKKRGTWYARFTDHDGRRHVERGGPRHAAINLYRRRREEVRQGKKFPENLRQGVTFSEIAQDAIERKQRLGQDPDKLRLVARWFPNRNAADVTSKDIKRELNRLRRQGHRIKSGLATATLNRFKAAVSMIFTLAMENDKVLANPARLFKAERENNERVRFLTEDEERRLRARIREFVPDREPDLDLALNTGLRKGEQYSLRWADVDLLNGFLTVRKGKGNKKRHVPLNAAARRALARLHQLGAGAGPVCPGGMGKDGYRAVREWFAGNKGAVRAAGINDFHWHDLRHTFASRLRQQGVELATIKELLGHTTLAMVLRYAHLAPGDLQRAVDKLAPPPASEAGAQDEATPGYPATQ